jgi:hypothetical protein
MPFKVIQKRSDKPDLKLFLSVLMHLYGIVAMRNPLKQGLKPLIPHEIGIGVTGRNAKST